MKGFEIYKPKLVLQCYHANNAARGPDQVTVHRENTSGDRKTSVKDDAVQLQDQIENEI